MATDQIPRLGFVRLIRLAPVTLGLAILAGIGSAACSIVPFWVISRIVGELFAIQADMAHVWMLVGWVLGLLLLRWALMVASHVLAHQGAFAIQHRLRLAMARRLGQVPLSFFSRRGSGSLRATLTDDVNSLEGFFGHMLPDAVAAFVAPVMVLVVLFIADWRLAIAALLPLPLAILVQWWHMRSTRTEMAAWGKMQQRIANQMGEYVRGIHVVKTFGLAAKTFGELAAVVHEAVGWVQNYARQSAGGWVMFTGVLSANLVIVAPVGAWLCYRGSLDISTYTLFLFVAPAVLSPLLRLTYVIGEQMKRADALHRISEVLYAPVITEQATVIIPSSPLDITFCHIGCRYGERLVLDHVSFTARAGQLTALVGTSGAGKSTLVRLVARLHEYDEGDVLVAGVPVTQWQMDALLSRLAIVFQDVMLFHGTVRDNLLIARSDATDTQMEAAARAAHAHDFIMALPQGYDTLLGERGARLSGGERQRLSIARALLKDAPVLLLDEATASVDAQSEAAIQQALATLCQGRTVLMIAHRLGTVIHADHIVVMDRGRVAGQGTHQTLLASCAVYRRLWEDYESACHWSLGKTPS